MVNILNLLDNEWLYDQVSATEAAEDLAFPEEMKQAIVRILILYLISKSHIDHTKRTTGANAFMQLKNCISALVSRKDEILKIIFAGKGAPEREFSKEDREAMEGLAEAIAQVEEMQPKRRKTEQPPEDEAIFRMTGALRLLKELGVKLGEVADRRNHSGTCKTWVVRDTPSSAVLFKEPPPDSTEW